jgi:hypothetical protein
MKVYLTLENKVIQVPPDKIPDFYLDNKWRLIFSDSMNMYVTFPPSPKDPPMATVDPLAK